MYNAQKAFFIIEGFLLTCQKVHSPCMMCHRLKNITNRSIESIRSSSVRLKKREKNLKSRKTEKNHSIATVFRDNNFKSRGMADIGIN